MSFALPNGSRVYIQKTKGATLDFTVITNAKEAVVTLGTEHGLNIGDEVLITSDWIKLNYAVARVKVFDATTITLGNINTTNLNLFPSGEGAGTITKITDWERVPQITEVSTDGGEQQYTQIQFLEDDQERQLKTIKSAKSKNFTFAHDSSLPIYGLLRELDESGDTVAMKMYVPKAKETRYDSVSVSFDPTPSTAVNEVETVQLGLTVQSPAITFYKD